MLIRAVTHEFISINHGIYILQWVMRQKDVRTLFALIVRSRNETPDETMLKHDFFYNFRNPDVSFL